MNNIEVIKRFLNKKSGHTPLKELASGFEIVEYEEE